MTKEALDAKPFHKLNVVLVDANPTTSDQNITLLYAAGIRGLEIVQDYQSLINLSSSKGIDIIAYEAGNQAEEGLEFIRQLRSQVNSNTCLPVIAISSHVTAQAVRNIMDAGATELVAKPASAKHVSGRIQTIVNSPRSYISTPSFKGPDRRRKQHDKISKDTRSNPMPRVVSRQEFLSGNVSGPVTIMPDFSLKVKIGGVNTGQLNKSLEDEFIFWALSDLTTLEAAYAILAKGGAVYACIERICNACLSIEARSGVYGYQLGCKAASSLTSFCRNKYKSNDKNHLIIIEKHIQLLSTVYHERMRHDGGDTGKELLHDLNTLIHKYSD